VLVLAVLASLAAVASRAQDTCTVPVEAPHLFRVTATTSARAEGTFASVDQSGSLQANETVMTRRGPTSQLRVPVGALEPAAERERAALEIYHLAREVLCGVRFPDASVDSIRVTYDGLRVEVWIEIGDAALGTRLVASPEMPASASALLDAFDALVAAAN